jgi:competence protein ComEC
MGALLAQQGSLFLWVPVCLGAGIAIYFGLGVEPGPVVLACCLGGGLAGLVAAGRLPDGLAPLLAGAAILVLGLAWAGIRTQTVAAPVLEFRYYGPVQGRIVEVDRSASDVPRLTLDRVVLADVPPDRTPARVRLSLQGDQRWLDPVPGTVVILTGHLAPPAGPVEPGDFDFRRSAWFDRLGAVGYTRTPVLVWEGATDGAALWLSRLRADLAGAVRAMIPGDAGGFAAAVLTGDRSGISVPATEEMRDSNLYHLVSISGMHMGILVGLVFGLVRVGVALVPPLALRIQAKKAAALVALPVAAFYLALAGRDIATERAFIMVAVMLVAILLDRQALTLRSVAMAALIVLLLRPEALVNPGFQMSFAAVAALVAAYQALGRLPRAEGWVHRLALPVGLLILSSLVAGLATAPLAAAHFNRVPHYGLLANLLAVPAMGLLVMPGGILMALLAPLGLGWLAAWPVELGSRWILWVASWVAGMEGSVSAVPAPPSAVLPLLAGGAVLVLLWQGRARWSGLALAALAMVLWVGVERPALLIAESGGLIGVLMDQGRALTRASGDGFAAQNWLENDGDMARQEDAAARADLAIGTRLWRIDLAGLSVIQVAGLTALEALDGCGGADVLVTNEDAGDRPCRVLDPQRLRQTGSVAVLADGRLVTAAELAGRRPWAAGMGERPASTDPEEAEIPPLLAEGLPVVPGQ